MELSKDIFGYKRNPKPLGVFSMEDSTLIFGGEGVTTNMTKAMGYLVQNWNVNYTQQVQELFEIGSNALYWAKGRPTGAGVLGRVIGARDAATSDPSFFPKNAYDICDGGATMVLTAQGGHCENPPATQGAVVLNRGVELTMSGCLVTSVGFTMQVGDVRLMENIGWRFAYMSLSSVNT